MKIHVEAYSGYKVNERPLVFIHQGRRYEVDRIVDRWYEGGLSPRSQKIDYYKVKTTEGRIYILRYLHLFDAWSLMVEPGF